MKNIEKQMRKNVRLLNYVESCWIMLNPQAPKHPPTSLVYVDLLCLLFSDVCGVPCLVCFPDLSIYFHICESVLFLPRCSSLHVPCQGARQGQPKLSTENATLKESNAIRFRRFWFKFVKYDTKK